VSPQVDEAVTLFARRLRYSSDPRSPRTELAAVFNERRQPSRITTAVRAQSGTFHGKIGLEPDRFSEIRQSAIEVALIVPRNGAVVVGPVIGLEADPFGVTSHLFIKVSSIKCPLEPFLRGQFPLADRLSRAGCGLLGYSGLLGRCRGGMKDCL